ncbi:MAG: thioesterase, partial [Candidatus Promineifilaceae bacterium]|nr:thioesterase [Candidatus Promineifilaceae bacterium]
MSAEFSRSFRVRWSETDAGERVGLAAYLRYLIETAWDWGSAGGLSKAESERLGIAWVVRETELTIERPIAYNDEFDFRIWLYRWRRVRGMRCFDMRLRGSEQLIACGAQQVATLDGETLRPVRLPAHLLDNFLGDNPRQIPLARFPKFSEPPANAFITSREVEWRDLDSFQHVNNAAYATFAENAALRALTGLGWPPEQFRSAGLALVNRRFHIRYHLPAVWGDRLTVAVYPAAVDPVGGTWQIDVSRTADGQTVVQCVLEWSVTKRETGAPEPLPEGLVQALAMRSALSQNGPDPQLMDP